MIAAKQLEITYNWGFSWLLQAASAETCEEDLSMRRILRRVPDQIRESDLADLRVSLMQKWNELDSTSSALLSTVQ